MPARLPRVGYVIVSFLSFLSEPLSAADITNTEVRYQELAYTVSFEAVLDAPHEHVRRLFTDYENMIDLSPTVIHSEIISSTPDGRSRVKLVLKPCFLIIVCRRITKVTDSSVTDDGDVVHVTVPAVSDFHQAYEQLSINPDANNTERTRVSYRAYLVPKFGAPPIIGPWVIRRQIVKELTIVARRVESQAQPM